MLILKVISRLLDYPTAELFSAAGELVNVVENSPQLSTENKRKLTEFIVKLTERDLYDAQESYDLLFDRGRALSLLLFEHVHGESRDRGQAMVDLMNVYQQHGFEVSASQLPDYIPLYLEFLSLKEPEFVQEWLGDVCHLLTMLSERLIERDCHYSTLFECLIELSGIEVTNREEIASQVRKEERDDTVEAIDKEWEDKEVKFDDPIQGACNSGLSKTNNSLDPNLIQQVPIKWHELDAAEVAGL